MKKLSYKENFSDFSIDYLNYINEVFSKVDKRKLNQLVNCFKVIREKGYTLFAIGYGGGAATATTLANDLGIDI